jgi:hypothetical protein
MDNHTSHIAPEFTIKAEQAKIHVYSFPGHLTHILQPLDVGVFQPYAHWHRKAIQLATWRLDIQYTIGSFFRDLPGIREKTFLHTTIQGAFRKSGIWLIKPKNAFELMKKYSVQELELEPEPLELPNPAVLKTPTRATEASNALSQLESKLQAKKGVFSSPSQQAIDSTIRGTKVVLILRELHERELLSLTERVQAQQNARSKGSNRRVLQKGGHITGDEARALIAERKAKHEAIQKKKRTTAYSRAWNRIRKGYRDSGVKARKAEKARINSLKTGNIDPTLSAPIPDLEKLITDAEINLQVREELIGNPLFQEIQFEVYEKALAQKREAKNRVEIEEEEDIELTQLPFATQQDYISLGLENGWESDAPSLNEEFEDEALNFMY